MEQKRIAALAQQVQKQLKLIRILIVGNILLGVNTIYISSVTGKIIETIDKIIQMYQ